MSDYFFVWLGSGRTRKIKGISQKCIFLDRALRAGLPVPGGSILLDWFFQLAVEEGVVIVQDSGVCIDKPVALADLLYTAVRHPRFDQPAAIRTAFTPALPKSIVELNCDLNDPQVLANVLRQAWTAVSPTDETIRRDLILMKMVDVVTEGTAVLSPDQQSDNTTILNQADTLPIPPLKRWGRSDENLPEYGRRLQKLLRGVRRTFGDKVGEVVWADDGRICWILQLSETGSNEQ